MKIAELILVVFFFCLISCEGKQKELKENNLKSSYHADLVESHNVYFKLDKKTSLRTSFIKSIDIGDSSNMLVYLNEQKPSILFYDIGTQDLVKEIMLHKEGPNAVGSPTGLYVQSLDSIYVVSSSYYRVTLVNGEGEAKRTYKLIEDEKSNESTGMLRPFTIAPPVVIDYKMYFNVAPDRDVYDKSYFQGKVNLVLDLETGKFEYFNSYPNEFKGGVWGVAAVNFSSAYNESKRQFIYSFSISDSVYVYDVDNQTINGYRAQTSSLTQPQEPMSKPNNKYDLDYALQANYYDGIVYDKYRSVYYRFVRQPLKIPGSETPNFYDFHRKPISVIILDEELNKIGETQLKDGIYKSFMYFLTKEGLFISTKFKR